MIQEDEVEFIIIKKPSYYQINKEKVRERYINNSEKLKAYQTEYNLINHEKYAEYQKIYYEKRKEDILREKKQKIVCECGKEVTMGHLSCHKKTTLHFKKLLEKQKQILS
jgi:hypothetical protein